MPISNVSSTGHLNIVTVDGPLKEVLHTMTEEIKKDELFLAQEIADKLLLAIQPHMPAAGLAAPQIGISKSIFIYSFDRDPKNLEIVINPIFLPILDEQVQGWEGCFSVILSEKTWKLAKIPRYECIRAFFIDREGKPVEKILKGFAAKVFQHECDHLQGIVNINRRDALVKSFESQEALLNFMREVKKEDSTHYDAPVLIKRGSKAHN